MLHPHPHSHPDSPLPAASQATAWAIACTVLATLMSALWLKERVSAMRWVPASGGFAGVLLIIRPAS